MPETRTNKELAIFNWNGASITNTSCGQHYDFETGTFKNNRFDDYYEQSLGRLNDRIFPLQTPHDKLTGYYYLSYIWITESNGKEVPVYIVDRPGAEVSQKLHEKLLPCSSIELPLTSLDIANDALIGSFGPLLMIVPPSKAREILAGNTNKKYLATTTEGLYTEKLPSIEHEEVSISKVLRGHCFLPIIVPRKKWDESTQKTLGVILVASPARMRKAIKAQPELLKTLTGLAKASLKRPLAASTYSPHTSKYWPSAQCLPPGFNPNMISTPKSIPLGETAYNKLNRAYTLRRHPKYQQYQSLNQRATQSEQTAQELARQQSETEALIADLETSIRDRKTQLTQLIQKSTSAKTKAEKLQEKSQEILKEIKKEQVDSSNSYLQTYLQNLDVRLLDYKTNLQNKQITYLEFETLKPHIIQVVDYNRNHLEDRVGGPWRVKMDRDGVRLASASPHTIRALIGQNEWRIHPHEPGRYVNTNYKALIDYGNYICEGELAPNLRKARQSGDVKIVIMAILTWLHCAFATDDWGRYYRNFPKPNEVSFDGETVVVTTAPTEPEVITCLNNDNEPAYALLKNTVCYIFHTCDSIFFKNPKKPTAFELEQYGKIHSPFVELYSSNQAACRDKMMLWAEENEWELIEEVSEQPDEEQPAETTAYNSMRSAHA